MKRIVLRPSVKSQISLLILCISCLLFAIRGLYSDALLMIYLSKFFTGCAIFFAVLVLVNIYNYKYTLFEDFIQATEGIFSLNMVSHKIKYHDIRLVETQKTIIGRIFNFGDVLIGSAATGSLEINLKGISDPDLVKDFILKKIAQKREKKNQKEVAVNQ